MASSNFYITPSTSLILIKSLAQPYTVYLSTLKSPDFQVSVRDTTGASTLQVVLSTIGGAQFVDGSFSYVLNKPYGFVNMSLRNSTFWQVLHTSGQAPQNSAANVQTINLSTLYLASLSTGVKQVSTLVLQNLETPNSIQLAGPFVIGNLSTPGFILAKSTFTVFGDTRIDQSLYVSGPTVFSSSLYLDRLLPFSNVLETYSSVSAGGSLSTGGTVHIFSTLVTNSSIQVQTLEVQKSTPTMTVQIENLQTRGEISTLGSFAVGNNLSVRTSVQISGPVSSFGSLFSTSSLQVGGNLTLLGPLSSLFTLSFASSMTLMSSLYVQSDMNLFSTASVGQTVSSLTFTTDLLSSSGSFSSYRDISIQYSFTVLSSLSASKLTVSNLVSVGNVFYGEFGISSLGFTKVASLDTQTAFLSTLFVSSSGSALETLTVNENATANIALFNGNLTTTGNLDGRGTAIFESTMGVASNIYVKGNMTVSGFPLICTTKFDVSSYELSTLQVTTSSPYTAVTASTFVNSTTTSVLTATQARLFYNEASGTVSFGTRAGNLFVETLYAKQIDFYNISTQTLYAESFKQSLSSSKLFDESLYAYFPRGLSSLFVQGNTVQANTLVGNFIGDSRFLSNIPMLFSTLSSTAFRASTVRTGVLTSPQLYTLNANVSTLMTVDRSVLFTTPFLFLSTGLTVDPTLLTQYSLPKIHYLQPLNRSTISITGDITVDSFNHRVGIGTSTPLYNLDISGSIYASGSIVYSTIQTLNFSTTKPVISFSTISFSSIFIQNSLVLPTNTAETPRYYMGVSNLIFGSRSWPQDSNLHFPGMFTSPQQSTIDIYDSLIIYNTTKNVGIQTWSVGGGGFASVSNVTPVPISSSYSLVVNGNMKVGSLSTSTLAVTTRMETSTLQMSMLLLNPIQPSLLKHTVSSSSSTITVDQTIEFFMGLNRQGSVHIARPSNHGMVSSVFCVYTDAYISSLYTSALTTGTILFGSQDL